MSLNFNVSDSTKSKKILILGGGFAGVGLLKKLQKEFYTNNDVKITLIDKNNFLLFFPHASRSSIRDDKTRHIVTPTRSFGKKQNFLRQM